MNRRYLGVALVLGFFFISAVGFSGEDKGDKGGKGGGVGKIMGPQTSVRGVIDPHERTGQAGVVGQEIMSQRSIAGPTGTSTQSAGVVGRSEYAADKGDKGGDKGDKGGGGKKIMDPDYSQQFGQTAVVGQETMRQSDVNQRSIPGAQSTQGSAAARGRTPIGPKQQDLMSHQ